MNVFEGNIALEYCPLVDCSDGYLVEIDDILVDVVKKFWEREIFTRYCCAGHLEVACSSPYIMFSEVIAEFFERGLDDFRELLFEMNADSGVVVIEEINHKNEFDTLVVRGACKGNDVNTQLRLKCQRDFVEFFYNVIERIDEIAKEWFEEEILVRGLNHQIGPPPCGPS